MIICNRLPLLQELVLENHGQTKLDFSKTSIHRLSIDLTGVEELRLNDDLEELFLLGRHETIVRYL